MAIISGSIYAPEAGLAHSQASGFRTRRLPSKLWLKRNQRSNSAGCWVVGCPSSSGYTWRQTSNWLPGSWMLSRLWLSSSTNVKLCRLLGSWMPSSNANVELCRCNIHSGSAHCQTWGLRPFPLSCCRIDPLGFEHGRASRTREPLLVDLVRVVLFWIA